MYFDSWGKFGLSSLGKAQQPQEQRYPFLVVCAAFPCVHTMVWLPVFGIFSIVRTDWWWCMRLHTRACSVRLRVCVPVAPNIGLGKSLSDPETFILRHLFLTGVQTKYWNWSWLSYNVKYVKGARKAPSVSDCWSLLYSAVLCSLADSTRSRHSRTILNEWLFLL